MVLLTFASTCKDNKFGYDKPVSTILSWPAAHILGVSVEES